MSGPALSILIPSHRSHFLHEAMGTVLNQTRKDIQLLVSYCDGSVPFWPEKVNELARAVRAPAMAVLGDDDLLDERYAERTLAKLDEGYDVVYTNWLRMSGETTWAWDARPWEAESFRGSANPLCGMTYVVRTDWFRDVGGADPSQVFWDWATAYALFKAGAKGYHLAEPLVVFREHGAKEQMDYARCTGLLHAKYPELKAA